jgi:hypothetical protein
MGCSKGMSKIKTIESPLTQWCLGPNKTSNVK